MNSSRQHEKSFFAVAHARSLTLEHRFFKRQVRQWREGYFLPRKARNSRKAWGIVKRSSRARQSVAIWLSYIRTPKVKMSEPNKPSSRQFHFGLLLLLSYLIFNLGLVIDQTLRWSDHWEGFLNGLVHAMFYIVVWGMFLLPWSLVIFLLYYWKKWRRFRSAWVLAPSILILALMLGNLIITPPTVSSRFSWITRSNLPENAENLRYSISGGGIADYYDRYYFETTPSEVERIIEEMELEEDERSSGGFAPLPGAPSSKDWENAQSYRKHESGSSWFYYLTTDESRTKVYICVGCT